MKRQYPSHLRLHSEDTASLSQSAAGGSSGHRALDEVDMCLRAFADATNWGVVPKFVSQASAGRSGAMARSASPSDKSAGRHWQLIDNIVRDGVLDECDLSSLPSVPMDRAQDLLGSIERLVQRLDQAEATIRRQEAELATAVLVTSHPDRQQETADRLESILESTARSVGAVAAAVYLLDESTSNLKMRSCHGLPSARLAAPPRELRGSLADLEALLGNAVLLTDIRSMREWPSPEDYESAMVVPIGTSSMPHGTIWFWCDRTRSFSPTEIEVANLAAGRIMAEIEQSILGHEVTRSRAVQKQIDTASVTQASMLPDTQILHEDFDISGWTYQSEGLGGAFHHWDIVPSGLMTFGLGQAAETGPEGCIVATSALAMIRTLWNQGSPPAQILRAINDLHWSMTDAEWRIALSLIQFNPVTGYGSLCNAGEMQSFIVSTRGARPIGTAKSLVGEQPDTNFSASRFILQPGEVLVSYTPNLFQPTGQLGLRLPPKSDINKPRDPNASEPLNQTSLLNLVRDLCDESANDITGYLSRLLTAGQNVPNLPVDRSLILVKNIRKAFQ